MATTTELTGNTYSITITGSTNPTNPDEDRNKATDKTKHEYQAYKIFGGKVWQDDNDTPTNTTDDKYTMSEYVFSDSVQWQSTVSKTVKVNGANGLTDCRGTLLGALQADTVLDTTFDSITQTATTTNNELATAVAEALSTLDSTTAGNAGAADAFANIVEQFLTGDPAASSTYDTTSGNYTITGLTPGYYLVKDKTADNQLSGDGKAVTGFILRLVQSVTVAPKSDVPTVTKKVATSGTANEATKTWQDVADYQIGDSIPYKLTGTLPSNLADYATYTKYTFTDDLSKGLTVPTTQDAPTGIVVKYYKNGSDTTGTTVTALFTSTLANETTPYTSGHKLTIALATNVDLKKAYSVSEGVASTEVAAANAEDTAKVSFTKDGHFEVTYSATLNSLAEVGTTTGNPNKVQLEYSNNPNHDGNGDTGKTPEDQVIVFTYKLNNVKGGTSDSKTYAKLKDAQFVLLKDTTHYAIFDSKGKLAGWKELSAALTGDDRYTASKYTAEGFTSTDPNYENTETFTPFMKSDENGLFSATGLDAATYILREVVEPSGYNKIKNDLSVTIGRTVVSTTWTDQQTTALITSLTLSGSSTDTQKLNQNIDSNNKLATVADATTSGEVTETIVDTPAGGLPTTGGVGTTMFYVIGGCVVAAALALLVAKKRKNA